MDLLDVWKRMPDKFDNEAQLDIFLRNLLGISKSDGATLGAYRKGVEVHRLVVYNEQSELVRGPEPRAFTETDQAEYALRREREAMAERDAIASRRVEEYLEPKRREFESYLEAAWGERMRKLETDVMQLRSAAATGAAATE